jgi:hypothetical protein
MKDQRQMRAARRTAIKQRLAATDTRIGEPNRLSRQITILLRRPGGWPWHGIGRRGTFAAAVFGTRTKGESALDGRDSLGGRDDFPQLRRRQVLHHAAELRSFRHYLLVSLVGWWRSAAASCWPSACSPGWQRWH